jgi:hypothetical protein
LETQKLIKWIASKLNKTLKKMAMSSKLAKIRAVAALTKRMTKKRKKNLSIIMDLMMRTATTRS